MTQFRSSQVVVDLDAITQNVRALKVCANTKEFFAVVKADGYGHGSVPVAKAALDGGATGLAVALVEEAVVLRDGGVESPILVLSEPPIGASEAVVALGLHATVYSEAAIRRLSDAGAAAGVHVPLHLKVDTGMYRVGCAPSDAVRLAALIVASKGGVLAGTFTHLAVADAPDRPDTLHQLDAFNAVLANFKSARIDPGLVHAANSAGTIAHPQARFDLVRCGIGIYGQAPDVGLEPTQFGVTLQPAVRVQTAVSFVKRVPAGARASYGLRYEYGVDSVVATVPIGYADGIPRRWFATGGEVLVGGRRCPIGGQVTMDQILVDCGPVDGPGAAVAVGDEVVLLGRQGDSEITVWEMALRLDTIAYEITCGLGARLPRRYVGARADHL